jgi:signal peptidase II
MATAEMSARSNGAVRSWNGSKLRLLGSILTGVVLVDFITKVIIQRNFYEFQKVNVIGEYLRITYIYNTGAAFGIHLGPYSRYIFLGLSLIALVALAGMYWATPAHDRVRLSAISLICAGAIGNLIDRVRSASGVVDFLDVGINNNIRWPVFNVADIAVTSGAILLALSLWKEEQRPEGSP